MGSRLNTRGKASWALAFISLAPGCRYMVSCLLFPLLLPCLPRHNWLSPQTVSQNNPFLPWFLQVTFVRHVVTTLRKWLTVSFSIFLTEFLEASKSQSIETRERLSGHLMKPESSVVLLFLSPEFPFTVLSFPANSPLLYYDIRIPPFIQHSSFSS